MLLIYLSFNCTSAHVLLCILDYIIILQLYLCNVSTRYVTLKFIRNLILARINPAVRTIGCADRFCFGLAVRSLTGSLTPYYVTRSALARLRPFARAAGWTRHLTLNLFRINWTRGVSLRGIMHSSRARARAAVIH